MRFNHLSYRLPRSIATVVVIFALSLTGFGVSNLQIASATNFIAVNSLSDNAGTCAINGTICLRNAITSAEGMGSASTIYFILNGTITIASPLTISNSCSNPITIDGSSSSIAIDGGSNGSVFAVNGSGSSVTLTGLTLQHRHAGFGGGVYNEGSLTLTNDTIVNNSAYYVSSTAYGGGGGLYNSGTTVISNVSFSGNSAINNGGGIENSAGSLTITNSTLSTNTAPGGYGGGLEAIGGTVGISGSTLSGNSASSGLGGALSNSGTASTTISSSTLSGNSADNGGAVYNSSTLSIASSAISGNTAMYSGGGLEPVMHFGRMEVVDLTPQPPLRKRERGSQCNVWEVPLCLRRGI